ncbi:MAG: hypothetical protein AUG03_01670 [Acidobacteria bacterium 13_1_20CM_2_68_14]|nr:MAG: hypothetical protein AUG03_01670 [Acidobacteria bacterium 13_1_20CM_2_68_14]
MSALLLLALLSCIDVGPIRAGESPPPPATPPQRLYGFHQIGLDAQYLATRPWHLDRRGKIKVAVTAGTAGTLFLLRNRIRDYAQEHRSEARDRFLQKPRTMGKGAFAPSLSLLTYGASFLTHDDREKETSVLLLESMAFTGIGVGLGQFVLSSKRPEVGKLAASVVPILRRQYLLAKPQDGRVLRVWKRTATGLLYAGAGLTAYQRINNDKHWAPDAFLGLVTGFTVGETLCDSHDKARAQLRDRLSLDFGPHGAALKFVF